jgi:hypothetical protein
MAGPALANRGRFTGSLLVVLGAWGALIPFVGPYFGFAYTPDKMWVYTSGRLWLSVVPGAAAVLGGFLVAVSDGAAAPGAFLAALGGAWFIAGPPVAAFALTSRAITPGSPVPSQSRFFSLTTTRFLETLGFYWGVGVVILFFAALSLGEIIVARMAARRLRAQADDGYDMTDQYGQYNQSQYGQYGQYGPTY